MMYYNQLSSWLQAKGFRASPAAAVKVVLRLENYDQIPNYYFMKKSNNNINMLTVTLNVILTKALQ